LKIKIRKKKIPAKPKIFLLFPPTTITTRKKFFEDKNKKILNQKGQRDVAEPFYEAKGRSFLLNSQNFTSEGGCC